MWSKIILIIIVFSVAGCEGASLRVTSSNRNIITKEWLNKNNKALVLLDAMQTIRWSNITTNNKKDDIYDYDIWGTGVLFIVTPGIYSLTYLDNGGRYRGGRKHYISKPPLVEGKIPYYSFEVKTGDLIYIGNIYMNKEIKKPLHINHYDKIPQYYLDLLPSNMKNSIKSVIPTPGFLLNDPNAYYFE